MGGDRIIQIEDSTAVGISSQGIQDRLKGPVGSEVQMTVYRPGVNKEYTFTITRDEIPLYSINTAYMVDDRTGYIEIDRFAMTTHEEFMEKLSTLKSKGMQRLVLDLRNNPGGVMKSAIEIADEMLAEGMTIVQTKGREPSMNNQYRATDGGAFEEKPVIVLVNRNSASASEIVTGALQDHDRALIVGERTFGKALVQKQFELNDGSLLQMTVGRYYTPVGRLIQTPYTDGDAKDYYEKKFATLDEATFNLSDYKSSIPDSLAYETDHGRTVFGGGGILPDYVVQPDTLSIRQFIADSGLDVAFSNNWFPKHEQELRNQWQEREDAFGRSYDIPDETVEKFWSFAEEKGLEFTTNPDSINPKKGVFGRSQTDQAHEFVSTRMKALVARQLYGSSAMRPIFNEVDPTFQKAMSLWTDAEDLSAYHSGGQQPAMTEQSLDDGGQ
jgi:carboxyl-terminal processing protease